MSCGRGTVVLVRWDGDRWADDPVRRKDGRRWKECRGRRGLPPPRKYIVRWEERAERVKNRYVIISDGA